MRRKVGPALDHLSCRPLGTAGAVASEGLAILDRGLEEWKPLLVVLNTVTFYLGGKKDMHRANEVREVMSALAARASSSHCAVVALIHLNKDVSSRALYRFLGSI